MTAEELKQMIAAGIEEKQGTITDAIMKSIENSVTKKFSEIEKGFQRRDIGTDSFDESTQFKSMGEQLQAIYKAAQPGEVPDKRLVWKAPYGANEAIPSEGGFLLQPSFSTQLITIAHQNAQLYGKCNKIAIGPNSNSLTLYGVDETSRTNGSRWGGVQVYWSDEAGTVTATKPKWREMNLKLKKLMGIAYATGELLADATALQGWITQAFSEEMAFKLDDGIFNGTGAGQLLGIMNSPCLVSQAAETNQLSATIVFENIINMWNRIPAANRGKAEWYIIQDAEVQFLQLMLAAGTGVLPVNIYQPPTATNPNGSLMGRPSIPIEQCQALGTIGDIVLADLSQYLIIDKGAVQSDSSIHVRFVNDEQTFRFIYRVDGQPMWHNTLTAFNSGTTRSPFVALASR